MKNVLATLFLFMSLTSLYAEERISTIDLTTPEVPKEIREGALAVNKQKTLEPAKLEAGNALLKINLIGYRSIWNIKPRVFVNNPVTGLQENYNLSVDSNGYAESKIPLVCTLSVIFRLGPYNESILLTPGKELSVYVDMKKTVEQKTKKTAEKWPVYFAGANADINNQLCQSGLTTFIKDREQLNKDILGMNAEQYKTYILGQYEVSLKELAGKGLSGKVFELAKIFLQYDVMYELFFGDTHLENAFRKANNIKNGEEMKGYVEPVFDTSYYSFLKDFPINDPNSLYCGEYSNMINSCRYLDRKDPITYLSKMIGTDQGIAFDLMKTQGFCHDLELNTPISAESFQVIAAMKDPFFGSYLRAKNDELLAHLEANKSRTDYRVHDIPAVSNDELFAALIKPYAGKVIFIDFWATWCSPCRSAMKQLEPAKEQYKGQEVVFLYLTGETSPLQTWQNMIPDIPGEHYRMSNDQNKYLRDKFGVRGIPSYLILNKKGEQVYFHVGFEGVNKVTGLLNEELKK